jgi:hypothetical protein
MPEVSLPQTIVLIMIIAAFVAFGVTLLGVSLYTMSDSKRRDETVERKVIQAKRASSAH